jgi:thiamine monophosphate synthase
VTEAQAGSADYVAIGPVFATGTKADAATVVGLEGVRRARALTSKPLVAIGGITRANCRGVIDAGAAVRAGNQARIPSPSSPGSLLRANRPNRLRGTFSTFCDSLKGT